MKWHTAAALTLLSVAALTGCAGSEGAVKQEQETATSTSAVDPSEQPAATKTPRVTPTPGDPSTPTDTATGEGPKVATFDESFVYNDGLRLRLVKVESDTLSRTGCCRKPGSPIAVFTFKLKNGTEKVFDPGSFSAIVAYGKAGRSAEQVFDTARGIGGGFDQKVMPGRVAVFEYAYSIPTSGMDRVFLQVDADSEHDVVFFKDSVD